VAPANCCYNGSNGGCCNNVIDAVNDHNYSPLQQECNFNGGNVITKCALMVLQ
jgi:hypothetical protein